MRWHVKDESWTLTLLNHARFLLFAASVLSCNSSTARMWRTFRHTCLFYVIVFMLLGFMPKVRGEEWAHVTDKGFDKYRNHLFTGNYCSTVEDALADLRLGCRIISWYACLPQLKSWLKWGIISLSITYLGESGIIYVLWCTRNKSISHLITWREW